MHISVLYATFQNCFKVVRVLPQLHKRYETFTAWNMSKYGVFSGPYFQCGPDKTPYLDIFHAVILQIKFKMAGCLPWYWRKPVSGMVLPKLILVNLRCLYKNNFKRTVFMMSQCIYAPKRYKTNSLTKIKFAL